MGFVIIALFARVGDFDLLADPRHNHRVDVSGGLLAVGLLLKLYVGVYAWSTAGYQSPLALLLSFNLVGLLASGLLVRYGLRMRRNDPPAGPNPNQMM